MAMHICASVLGSCVILTWSYDITVSTTSACTIPKAHGASDAAYCRKKSWIFMAVSLRTLGTDGWEDEGSDAWTQAVFLDGSCWADGDHSDRSGWNNLFFVSFLCE